MQMDGQAGALQSARVPERRRQGRTAQAGAGQGAKLWQRVSPEKKQKKVGVGLGVSQSLLDGAGTDQQEQ
jgi:hypothetical protein